MKPIEELLNLHKSSSSFAEEYGFPLMFCFAAEEDEYRTLCTDAGVLLRSYRSILEIMGKDRANWLHNLTTNQVKTLSVGQGNHAFALNVQGRILFEMGIFVRENSIWIDLDNRFVEKARKHFAKYTIVEDVKVVDRSEEFLRLAIAGPRMAKALNEMGVPNAEIVPDLGIIRARIGALELEAIRNDFCGVPSFDLLVPAGQVVAAWKALIEPDGAHRLSPVGEAAVQTRRIESAIPWPGREITEDVLPAETGQLSRYVNFNKGCYLGQEVVERMRSRDVVARRLVGLRLEGQLVPPIGTNILDDQGRPAGKITSSCRSPALESIIALGYVKTAMSEPGKKLRAVWDGQSSGCVVATPSPDNA